MLLSENIILWKNLENIRDHLLLDEVGFANFLDISYIEYCKSKQKKLFLSLTCLFAFSEKLNLHFEDLLSTDFKLNSKIINNDRKMLLAERYTTASYSKTRPILNMINYLELHRGTRAKINLFRKFQLTEDFILNPESEANILLISDIVVFLKKVYQFTPDEFMAMGQRTPFISKNKALRDQLKETNGVYRMYEFFFEECSKVFDENYHYRILSNRYDQLLVEARPKKLVLEELKISKTDFGNENVCLSKMGIASSLTWSTYKKFAPVKKMQSIYTGQESNIYSIDLSSITKSSGTLDSLGETQTTYH